MYTPMVSRVVVVAVALVFVPIEAWLMPHGSRMGLCGLPVASCSRRHVVPAGSGGENQSELPPKTKGSKLSRSSSKKKPSTKAKTAGVVIDLTDDDVGKGGGLDPSEKQELVQAIGEEIRKAKRMQQPTSSTVSLPGTTDSSPSSEAVLDLINPFRVGQNVRKTLGTAFEYISRDKAKDQIYYLDDRFNEGGLERDGRRSENDPPNPLLAERLAAQQEDYVPEVLVVGATGEVGRLVVQQLQLAGAGTSQKFRIRVLVRDLYTRTLNLFGTGVTYCQGDFNNIDSLEYALTDVDKIVYCSAPPRTDEPQFRAKFEEYIRENMQNDVRKNPTVPGIAAKKSKRLVPPRSAAEEIASLPLYEENWEQLDAVLEVRARLAEQVDVVGLSNLIRAYQNVRFADYGTSQAAKRSLFKFQDRPQDFNLFGLDDDDFVEPATDDDTKDEEDEMYDYMDPSGSEDDESFYDDLYGDDATDDGYSSVDSRRTAAVTIKTRVQWIRNRFQHGVFVGRIPRRGADTTSLGSEAAIVSSRLRSREDPENGIDLGSGFAGFILRVCSDGRKYEAFVRTGAYSEQGIEYVCEFSTGTKPTGRNKSRNKFTTVRLPFARFMPVRRKPQNPLDAKVQDDKIPFFQGRDVRNIGFRYRTDSNVAEDEQMKTPNNLSPFYLAFCYIKLYRAQPEPEFVYVSDARIPPVVTSRMVRHDTRQVLLSPSDISTNDGNVIRLLDESKLALAASAKGGPSQEETYFKYRGEEILKNSGLSYAIIRIAGYNEIPSGEASTVELQSTNEGFTLSNMEECAVSRAEVAQVCVKALMDPNALNKSFYMGKTKAVVTGPDSVDSIEDQFTKLPDDAVV
jgi:NAD(P)H-binding/Complex I intermediate-associated protein 30 (CIA30)